MNKLYLPLFVFILVTRSIGLFFLPTLLKFSPLILIILSPFIHHLVLASTLIESSVFILSGSIISIFQCTIGYGFGRVQGKKGTQVIIEKGFISKQKIDQIQSWIRFSAPLVLFLIPGPIVAMVSGVSKLKQGLFFTCMIPSQILWISLCYILGHQLELYLNEINSWLVDNWIIITLIIVLLKTLHLIYTKTFSKNNRSKNHLI